MRLILFGPPGSGKGTQAGLLTQRLGLVHISTGDTLRQAIAQGTPAGRKAEPFIREGHLVPDELVNDLVAERFDRPDRPRCFVMDGYPRNLAQAASFDLVLQRYDLQLHGVVLPIVDDAELVRRLSGRRVCTQCQTPYHVHYQAPRQPNACDLCGAPLTQRPDDHEDTVRERLHVYHARTEELKPYYRACNLLREVPGTGGVEDIYAAIVESLGVVAHNHACA
jgi:adenylate kinase